MVIFEFYLTCAQDGYVMTDDNDDNIFLRHGPNSTSFPSHRRHTQSCTQFATWGTLASILMDVCMLLKVVLNLWGMRKSAFLACLGIPILFFWWFPMVIDCVFFLVSFSFWGIFPLTRKIISFIDETINNADDDWI